MHVSLVFTWRNRIIKGGLITYLVGMSEEKDIPKKQLQMAWDYAKVETDIQCRIYLQIFAIFFTVGFSFTLSGLIEKSLIPYNYFGIIFIAVSLYYVYRTGHQTEELKSRLNYILIKLGRLK